MWYVVTGRMEFDDEDTCLVIYTGGPAEAAAQAEETIRGEGEGEEGEAEDEEREPRLFYLVSMLECPAQPQMLAEWCDRSSLKPGGWGVA